MLTVPSGHCNLLPLGMNLLGLLDSFVQTIQPAFQAVGTFFFSFFFEKLELNFQAMTFKLEIENLISPVVSFNSNVKRGFFFLPFEIL